MKWFLLFLGSICFVLLLVIFFQLLTGIYVQVPMFTKWVGIHIYITTVILLSFFAGVFFTSGINKFNSSNQIGDDFDL